MLPQFSNNVLSSFLLTVDHRILEQGAAYTNASGLLYPATGSWGYNQYTTPYRQLVNDTSITGANIMSGVYITGLYSIPGQNNIQSINITEGTVNFNNYYPSSVSGVYAVKDFSIYLTFDPEEKLLFETKHYLRSIETDTITGLPPSAQTYPAIYLKPIGGNNKPFALGGVDNRIMNIRAIILSDSAYLTDAACSILRNMANKYFPILNINNLNLDALGGYTGVNYNYNSLTGSATGQSYINKAQVSQLMETRQFNTMNPAIFPAFVDFELWHFMGT